VTHWARKRFVAGGGESPGLYGTIATRNKSIGGLRPPIHFLRSPNTNPLQQGDSVMTMTATNGQPKRKQLSDQLDRLDEQMNRLDSVLDALAEGLNQAVVDAAREGSRLAMKEAVIEILTDAELRASLHRASGPSTVAAPSPAPAKAGFWARAKAKAASALQATAQACSAAAEATTAKVKHVVTNITGSTRALHRVVNLKTLALVGLGAGLAVAATAYLAPHAVAAAVSGVGGAAAAVAVHIAVRVRKAVRALALI
jgi:hypothetical protein